MRVYQGSLKFKHAEDVGHTLVEGVSSNKDLKQEAVDSTFRVGMGLAEEGDTHVMQISKDEMISRWEGH